MNKLLYLPLLLFLSHTNGLLSSNKTEIGNLESRFRESHLYNLIELKLNETINLNKPDLIIQIFEDLIDYLLVFHTDFETVKTESQSFVKYYSQKFSMSLTTENLLKLLCYNAFIKKLSKIDRIAREINESRRMLGIEAQKIASKL